MMAYKRLSLTDITIPIGRGAKAKTVVNAWNAENVEGKRLAARKAKACANDFDRFKGMVASKTLRKKVR